MKVHNEDSRVMGAYRLYLADRDVEGFKARVIHKLLGGQNASGGNLTNMTQSAEERQSSITTAGFNRSADYLSRFSRGSTGAGPQGPYAAPQAAILQHQQQSFNQQLRPPTHAAYSRFTRAERPAERGRVEDITSSAYVPTQQSTQDRYLPVIINLECSNMLDEQTATMLKHLILEENVQIFRLINSHIARAIDEHELCQQLNRLAHQVGGYMERPISPIPKNKKQLLQFVNSLTRYHFKDKEDIDLLNKLIQEENEFVLSCFDVFDSDKDHENLIDSLQRILDKSKAMGFLHRKITPSAFYPASTPGNGGWRNTAADEFDDGAYFVDAPQPIQAYGLSSHSQAKHGSPMRPDTSQWNERAAIP